jgi:NAD(P)-dependent dehydrogenase (short-subunit alcohol dehydrogenase family)
MNIPSILITGCNRGLGLGLVKHLSLLKKPTEMIFATCRDIKKAKVS